jgi:hypothetical protein
VRVLALSTDAAAERTKGLVRAEHHPSSRFFHQRERGRRCAASDQGEGRTEGK